MLILEDINCLEDKQAALSLARVIETARRHGHEMLISCYRAPPAATLVDVGLTQECVVECTYLSKNETRKLVQGHGGDPRVWGNIAYIAGGNGHAQLVHAFVLGRAASGWPIENWEDLLRDVLSNSDVDGARFAARRYLISALPDDARQLLYRLSLVVGHFSRSLALSIGDVGPSLPNVGECIDQLVGPWITAIFCIDLGRVVGRRSDGVERAARVGEAGCVASGVVERPGARFGLEGDAEGLARTHQSHRG